jgi:ATP-dependent Clp protease ATP-binding subunit ClpA
MPRPQPQIADALQKALQKTFSLAKEARYEFLTLEHLLLALQGDPLVKGAVEACGGTVRALTLDLEAFLQSHMEVLPEAVATEPSPTLGFSRVLERAILHAISSEAAQVDGGAILAAMLQEKESHAAYFLQKHGVSRLPLLKYLSHGGAEPEAAVPASQPPAEEEGEEAPVRDPLKAYAIDLIQKAVEGRIDPLIGREEELERLIHVLCRRRKNNPLLVGETGVGKTAIAEGLALRLRTGRCRKLSGVCHSFRSTWALCWRERGIAAISSSASKPCSRPSRRNREPCSSSTRSTPWWGPGVSAGGPWMPRIC